MINCCLKLKCSPQLCGGELFFAKALGNLIIIENFQLIDHVFFRRAFLLGF